MGDLSRNFSSIELRCHCCGVLVLDPRLVPALQAMRDAGGTSCIVHDGYRCPRHNAAVGGAKDSQHLFGAAADITLEVKTLQEMYDLAEAVQEFRYGGIGVYDTPPRLHVDVRRNGPARWAVKGPGTAELPLNALVDTNPLRAFPYAGAAAAAP